MGNQLNFYSKIRSDQVPTYQKYFLKVIEQVDIENNTNWAHGRPCDKDKMAKDDELMEKLILHEAASNGIESVYLQIIVNQYFFADPWEGEIDKSNWVSRVLNRKPTDCFPDPWNLYKVLNGMNK